MARSIDIDWIRIDGGTQPRAQLSLETVDEYAESIESLPTVVVFFDGTEYWLADGFHRYHAHRKAGAVQIGVKVEKGTQRDAILYAVGANASHGLRRSNVDKRHSVMMLLRDMEWVNRSDRWIAEKCGVHQDTVGTCRRQLSETDSLPRAGRVGKDGVERSMPAPKNSTAPTPVQPTRTEAQAPIPKPRRAEAPAAPVEDDEADAAEWDMTPATIDKRWSIAAALMDLRPVVAKWAKLCPDDDRPELVQLLRDLTIQVEEGNWRG